MSFFDNFKEIGGKYLKAEDKQVLMDNGIPFEIVSLIRDEENQYGPRWVAGCHGPDPTSEGGVEEGDYNIAFPIGTVESRDRMLSQMNDYLEGDEAEPVVVKLEKVGRSILLRQP